MSLRSVLITGASGGIGEALALAYAKPGVHLFLGARRGQALAAVASACRDKGAIVESKMIDVTQQKPMEEWVLACDQRAPLDLVIANAGISGGTHKADPVSCDVCAVFRTNLDGVLHTVMPIIPFMKDRKSGQIALMSSLAGFRGMPGAAAYCSSKAAVRTFGEALRGELAPFGVKVNVMCPGFVQTPMTDVNTCVMPFLVKREVAAQKIIKGLAQNKARISFPWPMALLVWLFSCAPTFIVDLFSKLYEKQACR